jgi:hypothetical protein
MIRRLEGSSEFTPVSKLQGQIESGWRAGFDPTGAHQLNNRVVGTRKRVGATECVVVLRASGYRTCVVDFETRPFGRAKPSGARGSPDALLAWALAYFSGGARGGASNGHDGGTGGGSGGGGGGGSGAGGSSGASSSHHPTLTMVDRPPVYLQHNGHSRLVVGVVAPLDASAGRCKPRSVSLVVFDPAKSVAAVAGAAVTPTRAHEWQRAVLVTAANLTAAQYQAVYVTEALPGQPQSSEEKRGDYPTRVVALDPA